MGGRRAACMVRPRGWARCAGAGCATVRGFLCYTRLRRAFKLAPAGSVRIIEAFGINSGRATSRRPGAPLETQP
eukprot:1940265-Prymnesium_polylepis.1